LRLRSRRASLAQQPSKGGALAARLMSFLSRMARWRRSLAGPLLPARRTAPAPRDPALAESVEPRILYSADAIAGLLPAASSLVAPDSVMPADAPAAQASIAAPAEAIIAAARATELVFVDPGVPDAQRLVDAIAARRPDAAFHIIELDPTRDGLAQITEALAGQREVAAIHIVSHGEPGAIELNGRRIDAAAIETEADQFTAWRAALGDQADLLIYGCDVASTPAGIAMLMRLAELTGADVAGSTDLTGSADAGGDWTLEATIGAIQAGSLFADGDPLGWNGLLPEPVVIGPGMAPALNPTASPAMPSILEGATNPSGITVAELVVDGSITDGAAAGEAIAITALDTSLGTWQYSTDGGANWLTIDAEKINSNTNELALLLGPTASIRMLPFGDLNGTLSSAITFRAWSMATGATGDYVVITDPGDIALGSDFSSFTDTASLTVTAVNDAPTFARVPGTGKLIVPVSGGDDFGQRVNVQPDGRILMAGYSWNGTNFDFSLSRLNGDGSLDTTLDGDGKVLVPVASNQDYGRSLTVQPDGKILVAGHSVNGSDWDFSLIRLNADGSPDTSFDGDGKLIVPLGSTIVPLGSTTDIGYSVTVQPDGKILLAGYSSNGIDNDFSLIRLNADGSLDTSFDSDGKLIVPVDSGDDSGRSITVQPDGKILVAGYSANGADWDFSLIRLNVDGSLDTSFDGDGKLLVPDGSSSDFGYSVTVQPDGKILVAGSSSNGIDFDFSLIRLNGDGSLDTTLDGDGKVLVPVGSSQDTGYSVTVQPDGKILVAGTSSNGTDSDFSLIRLNVDGSLDTSFDGDGKLIVPVGSSNDIGYSVSLQPDGKILVAGYSSNGINNDFSLIRVNADGSLDTTFNGTAANTLGGSVSYTEGAAAVALDAGVAIYDADLAALNSGAGDYSGASITLARSGGANAEDVFSALNNLSFTGGDAVLSGVTIGTVSNTAGTLSITFNSNATQARVDELLSSLGYANSSDVPPSSVQIVWTFSDGNTSAQGSGGALTAQGTSTVNITAVNDSPVLNTSASPALPTILENATNPSGITVASLVVDGSITDADGTATEAIAITALDTSLGTWQYSIDGGTNWLTIDAAKINSTTNELALLLGPTASLRMLPFGELNGTLSTAITFRAWDMTTGAAGDYTVITNPGTGTSAFSAASDTASLTVTAVNDAPTFAPVAGSGKLMVPVGSSADDGWSMVVQPDGKILVAGFSWNGSDYDFSLIRLNADGTLDTTFDNDGKRTVPVGSIVDASHSVTLQPDGKILVAGYSTNGTTNDFSLIRLNADGSLDTSFDGDGKLIVPVGSSDDGGYSVTVQPDGKIVVAGFSSNGTNSDFSLIRLNVNGSLDTTFDGDGKLIVPVGSSNDYGRSVTVQPDGKILVAGYSTNGTNTDFSLIRLNADGSLDTSFDGDGKLIVPVGSSDDDGFSVTVQPDGKILVAGYSYNGTGYDFSLILLNADGTLDTTLDSDGKLIMPVGTGGDFGSSATVQPDGKILVAGYSYNGTNYDFSLIRLNADGTLDTTFDNDGKLIVPVGSSDDYGSSVTVQPDGKILVAGRSRNGLEDFSLIRVNADGSLDTTFNGAAANTLGGSVSYTEGAAAVALDAGVAIYDADLAALNNGAGNYSGASVGLLRSGGARAEDVFSALGNLSFTGGNAVLSGVTVGTASSVAGTLSIIFNSNATQARVNELLSSLAYANLSNAPSASVQIVWTFSDGNASAQGSGGALTAQGTTTVSITAANDSPVLNAAASPAMPTILEGATNPAGITVASLAVDGSITDADGSATEAIAITALDTSLGTWQYSTDGGTNWLTIDAAKINSSTNELALLLGPTASIRMLPFGDLSGTLSTAITFRAWDMTSGATGDYTVITNPGTGTSAFSAASDTASLTVTAVNDAPTFAPVAGTGKLIVPVGTGDNVGRSLTVQPDGKILMAGLSYNGSDYDFSLIRLNGDGSLDASFDGDGKRIVSISGSEIGYSVTVQPDGKILVAGSWTNGIVNDFSLTRLNADGSLDTSFDGDGTLIVPVGSGSDIGGYSVAVQPDGRILVAGYSFTGTDYDFSVIRLNSNGSLDTSFDGDGKLIAPVGSGSDYGLSLSLQPDGKIVVAGHSNSNGFDSAFSLIRLNGDGSLDTSFDGDGKRIVPVGTSSDIGYSVTVQPDGKILMAGGSVNGVDNDFSLIRLNVDGSLDTSFDGDGKLIVPVGTSNDYGYSLSLQPDGKILVAGYSVNGTNNDFSLIRVNADGTLDTSFDGDGKLIVPVGTSSDIGYSVTVQPDGKILMAGGSVNGADNDFSLIRLNADGSLDTTFNGTATNTLGGSVSFTENAAAVALDAGVAIYDADLAALNNGAGDYSGASITLARNGGANAEDVFSALGNLSFASGNAVLSGVTVGTVSNTAGTLSITFNSNATQARVDELLSSLGYANSSEVPPSSVQIVWTFTDGNTSAQGSGGALTTQGTSTVNITAVNDAPSGTSATLTTTEDTPRVLAATDFGFTDANDSPANAFLAVSISTLPNAGSLTLDGIAVTLGQSISVADINAGKLVFTPVTNANGTAYSSFTFRVQDDGGTANGGVDLDPIARTIIFNVTAVNDSPVLNAAASPSLPTILEGATNPAGVTVASLAVDGSITDADGSATEAIAITALDTSLGTWQYSIDGGINWLTIDAAKINSTTNELALLLGPTASIRMLPFGDLNGTLSSAITFRAWGMATGATGDYVVITDPGNIALGSDFSSFTDTASLTVTAVNDAPTFAPVAGTGKLMVPVGSSSDIGQSLTIQPDGKIIVAGYSSNGIDFDFSLVRLNADGSLDNAFGSNGKLIVPVGSGDDSSRSVTLQPDGRILVAGFSRNGSTLDFSLIRLNVDGSLDTAFDGDGKVIVPVGSSTDIGYSVIVQPDGKILMSGSSTTGSAAEFSLIRLNVDGSLDNAFGTNGKLLMPVGSVMPLGSGDYSYSLSLQPDGKILMAGYSSNGTDNDFSLIRLNVDGSLDTSFDVDGKLLVPVGSGADIGRSLSLQPDGKILMAGYSSNGTNNDFSLIRLNVDGSLDTSFDGDGKLIVPVGSGHDYGYTLRLQPDGKILVAGHSINGGNEDFSLIRLNADGSLDTSFDGDGKLIVPVGSSTDSGLSLSLQPDGRILVAGYSVNDSLNNFSLIRVNADGSLDTAFGSIAANTLGGSVSYTEGAAAVALDADVAIYDADLVALNNGAGDYSGASITLARSGGANAEDVFSALNNLSFTGGNAVLSGVTIGTVSNAAGTLSITFNGNATQARVDELLSSLAYANASGTPPVSVQIVWTFSDGNTSAQGSGGALTTQGTTTVNITLNPGNQSPVLDTAFSPTLGSVLEGATNPSGITVASLVVDGSITDGAAAGDAIAITALDTSLGTWQYSINGGINWLTIDAAKINSTTNELALLLGPTASIRMLPFGDLNGTLSSAITFRAWDMSSGATGDYTVITNPGTGTSGFSAATDSASLTVTAVNDAPTFAPVAGSGKLLVPVGSSSDSGQSMVVQPDGKILVAGYSNNSGNNDFSLIRLNGDGSLDTSFDSDGKLIVPVGSIGDVGRSVTVQPDGKILVSGYAFTGGFAAFSLIRLNGDGSLDTSFDGDGKLIVPVGSTDDGRSVTVQPDGKILVAGYSFNGTDNDFSLIRLNLDGTLDTSFDGDGKLMVPVGGGGDNGYSVTVQPDGKILVAGYSFNGTNNDFSLIRLNADGTLDTSFDGDGKLIVPVGSSDDVGYSVTLQPDGKILVAGYSSNGTNPDFSLIRLNADGSFDTTFDIDGKLIVPVGSSTDSGQSMVIQPDGKILVAGFSLNGGKYGFSLIRLNADGSLDTSFDGDGKLIVEFGGISDYGYSISLQPDGKILVAGASYNGSNYDFSLIRVNADGSLDTTFNGTAANTLGGSVSYTENAAAVALDAGVAIYDADLAALNNGAGDYNGASITLARDGGANAEDVFSALGNLSFTGGNAVLLGVTVGTVSNAAGMLSITFNSNATQARVGELLSSLAYANASGTPPASVQIVWTFSDGNTSAQGSGGALTAQGTSTVNITAVNDAPSGTSATLTTLEDTPRVLAAADFGFADANDSPANALLAVSISTLPTAGSLTLNGTAVTLGQSISVADINAGRLVFTPVSNANGNGYASFTFQVQDDGGTANGGIDLDPTARTINFNVTAVSDAPSGANATLTTNEDTPWVFAATDFGFTDSSDTAANAFIAVTMSSLPTAGSLTLAGTAVTVGQSISIADINAGRLVFTPGLNANGNSYASFTFRVQDDGGTANGGVDLDPTAKTITVNVIAVNDAPVGASATLTMTEGTPWVFAAVDFGFTEASDTPANALMAVTMSSLPTAGSLTLAGASVTVGQSISIADINAGRLVFTPVTNTNGTGYASFTFRVQDNGGTTNGGVDLDPTAKTITFNVTAVNDAPSGANATFTTTEDTPWVFAATDFGFTDASDTPANALMAVTMSSLPTAGSLTLAGTAVTVGQSISVADINAGRVVFTPVTNSSGTGYASITFRVQDNGGTANGGVDLDPTAKTITFNVIADNDAPSGASATFTTTEDTPWVFAATDFGFSDTNDSPANALMAVTMSSLPTAGSLTLAGIAVTAGQSISIGDINAGQLVFTPVANGNSTAYASLTFQVQDNGGTANGGVDLDPTARTITLNVMPVNDAPSGANATYTTTEDTAWVFAATDFGFSDTNDSPSNALMAVTMSSLPTADNLTLAGTAVTVGQSISVADISAGRLVFTPVTNGTGSASFTFRVQDNGGIANGGVDLDPTAKTITFNVTPVNSAPVITSNGGGASAPLSVTENSTSVTQVTATDIDLPAQRLGYSIVGGADAARFVIDTNTGLLSFVSSPRWHLPADANGDNRYQVIVGADDGSLLTTQALAITVTNLPDAPVVTAPPAATLLENTGIPIAGLSVSDVDGNLSTVSLRVEHGSLALDLAGGATIVAGEQGSSTITLGGNASELQAALASLSYRSVRDFYGSDTLQVLATDATGLQSGASTAITITPINHLPEVNAPGSQATLAGMPLEFRVEGNNPIFITDIDDIESTLRVTLTVNGGSLSIATVDGLTLAPPLGVGADSRLIIEGPMRAVNAALATLSFLPADDFFGETRLDLIVRDLTDPASGVDLPRSVPIEVSLPPTFARTPGSPIPVSTPPVMSIPVTSTPGATTPATSTSVGTTTVTSSPVGTTPVLTPPVGSSSLPAAGTASATDAASGRESAKPGVSAATSASSREDALAPIMPSLITAPGADRSDIAIRLIAPVAMALSAPTDISAARRLESSMTVSTVVRAFESQALVAGVFVVTPDSVSVIGLADDTRNSIDPSPQATEIRLRSESLELPRTVADELTLSSLSVQSTAAAVSAGVVWWLVNGGTLLWIVLTYGPLARTFDPLPILARERRDDEDDDGLPDRQDPLDVPTLFDDPNAPSPAHTPVPDNISRQPAAIVESA
jgi:uncharacterized delta-60 repeat protein